MANNDSLTPKQHRALAALLQARTIGDAAAAAQISMRQLMRWLQQPEFVAELRKAEAEIISDAVRALVVDLSANHQTLRAIRDDETQPGSVRVRAAVALDDSLLRWRELLTIETRITELEARLNVNQE